MLEQCVRELAQASGLRLELPEEFEGDSVKISVSAKSVEDVQALARKFQIAAGHDAAKTLFAILRGEY